MTAPMPPSVTPRDLTGHRLGPAARKLFQELRAREHVGGDIAMPTGYPWAVELYSAPHGRLRVVVRTSIRNAQSPDGWLWEPSYLGSVNARTVQELLNAGYAERRPRRLPGLGRAHKHYRGPSSDQPYLLVLTEAGRREVADA